MLWSVPIFYERHQFHVEHRCEHLHRLVNLPLCHLAISVKVFICCVDDFKELLSHLLFSEHLTSFYLPNMEVVSLHDHLANLLELLGNSIWDLHKIFIVAVVYVVAA